MDWREKGDYAYTDDLNNHGWAWEFLRRNQNYVSAYKEYCNVLLKHKKDNNSQPLRYFTPERKKGETGQQWMKRCMATEESDPRTYDPDEWHGRKWHLKKIISPQDYYSTEVQFVFPWPQIVPPDSFNDFYHTPDEAYAPIQPVTGKALLAFDLSLPINHQLKLAKNILREAVRSEPIPPLKTKEHTYLWVNYLRILDAIATTPKSTYSEIADTLFKNDQGADPKGKAKDTYIQAVEQSERYLNILYRIQPIHKTFSGK